MFPARFDRRTRPTRPEGNAVSALATPIAAAHYEPAMTPDRAHAASTEQRVGIIGAGKLGMTLARLALAAGYEVAVAGSGAAERIELTIEVLAPGAIASTVADVVDLADVIVLAVPTHRFRELPSDMFDGKVVVDAMNYWPDTDGEDAELASADGGSSTVVQAHFPGARIVKSLNQLGYHELEEYSRGPGALDRAAVAAAGDDREAVRTVMHLVERLGFDAVDGGELAIGKRLEPDGSPYAETFTADTLAARLTGT
jgi:8-hydroxy-5-deazaflavin:NADPH oxidoreductase